MNGVEANGPIVATDCKYVPTNYCALAGSWWLDVDAAEAAHPGLFVAEPLVVELLGGANTTSPPTSPTASVTSVRVTKK